jgi:hypothetical protein
MEWLPLVIFLLVIIAIFSQMHIKISELNDKIAKISGRLYAVEKTQKFMEKLLGKK